MKRSLTWLWLIGAVLYAVSTWLFADAVHNRDGQEISSSTADPTSPVLGFKKAEHIAAAQNDLPAPKPSLTPEPPVADAAVDEKSTAKLDPATSSVGQGEQLVVSSTANIRSEPSSKSTLIGTAQVGAELEVAERQARWVRFVDPATSNSGWIYEGLLAPLDAVSVPEITTSAKESAKPKAKRPARNGPEKTASRRAPKQPSVRASRSEYTELTVDEDFRPHKRRFGFFARRQMLRDGLLTEEFTQPR